MFFHMVLRSLKKDAYLEVGPTSETVVLVGHAEVPKQLKGRGASIGAEICPSVSLPQ